MISFLRVVRLLAITLWVGGLCFFAFVVAPVTFGVLAKHEAGMVVAGTLGVLNRMGPICGVAFVAATGLLWAEGGHGRRWLSIAQVVLALGMIATSVYVQWRIVPAMERDRVATGGDVDAAAEDNRARVDFERLHSISEKVEGAALFMGLGVVVLMGLEGGTIAKATLDKIMADEPSTSHPSR